MDLNAEYINCQSYSNSIFWAILSKKKFLIIKYMLNTKANILILSLDRRDIY